VAQLNVSYMMMIMVMNRLKINEILLLIIKQLKKLLNQNKWETVLILNISKDIIVGRCKTLLEIRDTNTINQKGAISVTKWAYVRQMVCSNRERETDFREIVVDSFSNSKQIPGN
jgi:hypothetical protein